MVEVFVDLLEAGQELGHGSHGDYRKEGQEYPKNEAASLVDISHDEAGVDY